MIIALALCWAVLGAPTGKRLAPIMSALGRLRRFDELDISDEIEAALLAMSPATMDRRLAGERAKMALSGRSHTKLGSLLKTQIPIRTWAQWDDAVPGFVEIDLVGHEGGNAAGEHCFTLTVTDIATGWTENRSVRNKAQKWCSRRCWAHVEQKNWAVVRTVVGYHRYDTAAELAPLNKVWVLQSLMSNYFYPQQKLVSKVRDGAKVTKKYDRAETPHRRAVGHQVVGAEDKNILATPTRS